MRSVYGKNELDTTAQGLSLIAHEELINTYYSKLKHLEMQDEEFHMYKEHLMILLSQSMNNSALLVE